MFVKFTKNSIRSWLANLCLVFGSLLISLIVGEVSLRLIGVHLFVATFGQPDEIYGWSNIPRSSGWFHQEGSAYVKINSYGYRDYERKIEKPEETFRIAVLGDSFIEGRQVDFDRTVCVILEKILNGKHGFNKQNAEVLNFGVSGYGTAQELLTLENQVYKFKPDMVILSFFSGNDIIDNSKDLDPKPGSEMRPFFRFSGDKLVLDNSFRNSPAFKFRRSLFGMVVYSARNHSRLVQLFVEAKKRLWENPNKDFYEFNYNVYREPNSEEWENAWKVTESIILKIHDKLSNKGIKFAVVTLSNGIQVYPDISVRQRFMKEAGLDDLFYPDRRIKALGDEAGFPVLNLSNSFQEFADSNNIFFHGFEKNHIGFGHWNIEGHRFAAELISKWLNEILS